MSPSLLFLLGQIPEPTGFTAWGSLGLLGIVIITLTGVLWKIILKQSVIAEVNTKNFMDFIDKHRSETTSAMREIASSVSLGQDKMSSALLRQARALDEILLANRVLDKVAALKDAGTSLSNQELDNLVRAILHERSGIRGES